MEETTDINNSREIAKHSMNWKNQNYCFNHVQINVHDQNDIDNMIEIGDPNEKFLKKIETAVSIKFINTCLRPT